MDEKYSERVNSLVDDLKEHILKEFLESDRKNDPMSVKEMILLGRTLEMFAETATKLQIIESKLDTLLAEVPEEDEGLD